MPDSPNKIKWHPAFYAATELELYEDTRKEFTMCDALRELMKDDIDKAKLESELETSTKAIHNIMETLNLSVAKAMDALKIPDSQRELILQRLK